jgi:hypothetical protein
VASTDGTLPETGLHKGTNWWGAFVIGLAAHIHPVDGPLYPKDAVERPSLNRSGAN